ncbi:MAG: hypothetical protein FWH04_07080 [Oscillospiraceae bacterium]|nr:hypothetical protein [Oscillospiraceae bacterium]
MQIEFTDFMIEQGIIEFKACRVPGQMDDLYFRFSSAFVPRNDLIAIALSTLCGQAYDRIHIDLVLSAETIMQLGEFTSAEITCAGTDTQPPKKTGGENIALSFSGGFDSLAALCVMPDETKLISLDFGHWFKRETDFFEKFDTNIVSTNFRVLKYDKASWTFMGVAAILYSDYLGIGHHAFGTIFESDKWRFATVSKNCGGGGGNLLAHQPQYLHSAMQGWTIIPLSSGE